MDETRAAQAVARSVRAARQRMGTSIDQLAARAGVSKGALVALEKGSGNPNLATLVRIADSLGVTVSSLLEDDGATELRVVDASAIEPLWRGPQGGTAVLVLTTPGPGPAELWRWHLEPGEAYGSHPHQAGVVETVTVLRGELLLMIDGVSRAVGAGSSAVFGGDREHSYQGGADGCTFVMTVHLPAAAD